MMVDMIEKFRYAVALLFGLTKYAELGAIYRAYLPDLDIFNFGL